MELGLCIEMALTKLPFEDRLRQAAALGFKNVEMWFADGSYTGQPEALAALAVKHGVTITNTVIGSPDGGVGGGLTNPANRAQWLARAKLTLDFNQRANIPATIVCTGNAVPGLTDAAMLNSVIEGLKPTLDLADQAGVTLLLESLNTRYDHPGYWLNSSDRGAAICRQLKSARMRLLFDCYHMQIMESDLLKHIERNFDVIGHFHSAGVPGRNEVFNGEINYPFVLAGIEKLGYQGVFALEYQPTMADEISLAKTRKYLGA